MNSKKTVSRTSRSSKAQTGATPASGPAAVQWPFPPWPLKPDRPSEQALLGSGRSTMTELTTELGPAPF